MSNICWNKNDTSVTVFIDGEVHTIPKDAGNYGAVVSAIRSDDVDAVRSSINVAESIKAVAEQVLGEGVVVTENEVYYNGKVLHNALASRIVECSSGGFPVTSLVNLLANFYKNPLVNLVNNPEVMSLMGMSGAKAQDVIDKFTDDFFSFLNHRNLPLTEDGCFIAYKTVDSNYWSKATGSMKLVKGKTNDRGQVYNGIGEDIECKREEVDPNRYAECSYGLHVGCLEYSGPGGWYNSSSDKVVLVKVNPADVVAIPPDHNRTKMRTCAYKVMQDYAGPLKNYSYSSSSDNLYGEEVDAEYEDIDVNDVEEGNEVKFVYNKSDGTSKTRNLLVQNLEFDRNGVSSIGGLLVGNENNAGEYRKFKVTGIENRTVSLRNESYNDDFYDENNEDDFDY